jgi:hypothetical protein
MTDGVYATVDWVQTTTLQTVVDRVSSDVGIEELSPRHHSVLSSRQVRDEAIINRPMFARYIRVNFGRAGHSPRMTGKT